MGCGLNVEVEFASQILQGADPGMGLGVQVVDWALSPVKDKRGGGRTRQGAPRTSVQI